MSQISTQKLKSDVTSLERRIHRLAKYGRETKAHKLSKKRLEQLDVLGEIETKLNRR